MTQFNPPFRADQVGSLLRPEPVLKARDSHQAGDISAEELRSVEDDAIFLILTQSATPEAYTALKAHPVAKDLARRMLGPLGQAAGINPEKGLAGTINFAPPSNSNIIINIYPDHHGQLFAKIGPADNPRHNFYYSGELLDFRHERKGNRTVPAIHFTGNIDVSAGGH